MTDPARQLEADHPEMAAIRVEPLGAVLYVRDGETLMQAAARQGYHWPSICQGEARCGLCSIEV
ncbi:MAG TPA: 2Fe-2S iron-sulfur cluster-binding protein, partial [Allosphingosinicella sp.]|nr:2Fe-2S iron-sulfur cluster-binding protein [Allosphingosinicella sp.]